MSSPSGRRLGRGEHDPLGATSRHRPRVKRTQDMPLALPAAAGRWKVVCCRYCCLQIGARMLLLRTQEFVRAQEFVRDVIKGYRAMNTT